jgi:hypothetical protein
MLIQVHHAWASMPARTADLQAAVLHPMQKPSHPLCLTFSMQPGLVSHEPFDVLLQTVHQDKAHRLCLYAAAKDLAAWPPSLAEEVGRVEAASWVQHCPASREKLGKSKYF